ncbi:MAG TPA: hypothetical protein VFO19_19265, partial [Vicinamibacterales bacterium]|nr:hypothetical protein [Vicinamibacterales bacterium]
LPVLTSAATNAPLISRIEAFARAAIDAGLQPALRVAMGAAITDPAVRERPQWFRHGADGSITLIGADDDANRIAAFDFDGDAWEVIWMAIREQLIGWTSRGIRTFVVDDPETAPLTFWEWLIAGVQRDAPDAVFVCDGARRLAVARRLSKSGASQIALTLPAFAGRTELTTLLAPYFAATSSADMRLQLAGGDIGSAGTRNAIGQARIQITLAATLSPICLVRPDRGLDDLDRVSKLLRSLLRVRRTYASFAAGSTLTFHDTDNEQLLCFSRVSADGRQRALVVVNLDPVNMQHGWVQVPAADWGLSGSYAVHDELNGQQFDWHGARNYVRLEPSITPAHVLIFPDVV